MTARNNPQPISVDPLPNHMLYLVFENGEHGIFDTNPYVKGSWYGQLSDEAYFNTVRISCGTVEWANGQDLCPDELYENSIKG